MIKEITTNKIMTALMRTFRADVARKLSQLRQSGAVPDHFECSEPASLPKIALLLAAEEVVLSERAKQELKNMRHFV